MTALETRNTSPKNDILDAEQLPLDACDLNFRGSDEYWLTPSFTWQMLQTTPGGILFAAFALALHRWIDSIPLSVVGIVAVVFGVVSIFEPHANVGARAITRFVAGAVGFIMIWTLAIYLFRWPVRTLAITTLVIIVPGWIVTLADALATHAVAWSTANPTMSHKWMTFGRKVWRERFQIRSETLDRTDPKIETALDNTSPGIGYVFRIIAVPVLHLVAVQPLLEHPSTTSCLLIVTRSLLIQIPLFLWTVIKTRASLHRFYWMLKHWYFWDPPIPAAPMMFRSPGGTIAERQFRKKGLMQVITAVLFVVWLPLLLTDPAHAASDHTDVYETISLPGSDAPDPSRTIPLNSFDVVMLTLVSNGVLLLLAPALITVICLYNIAGPAISDFQLVFDNPINSTIDEGRSEFDGYTDRLINSTNPAEQRCSILGHHPATGLPILVDSDLDLEHRLVVGPTGSGKSALALQRLLIHQIRCRRSAVIYIDCKGDMAQLQAARLEAAKFGVTFKWFTTKPGCSTFVFNPVNQSYLSRLTMQEVAGLFMTSLNLHHGNDYGRAWFGMAARTLFQQALIEIQKQGHGERPYTFREISDVIRRLTQSDSEFKAAQHLAFVIANLSEIPQLNFGPGQGHDETVVRNAIHMPDVIANREIIYLFLPGATDVGIVGEIARLVLYSGISAAVAHRDKTGETPSIQFIIDEAQIVVAQNIENVLAQARAAGVGITLAMQSLSQLKPTGGTDLRDLVLNCTAVKQFFGARDPYTVDYLMKLSGETTYYKAGWKQSLPTVLNNDVKLENAAYNPQTETQPYVSLSAEPGPRLTAAEIADISRHPNRCIVSIARAQGYSCYAGAFPVHVEYPITKSEFQRRNSSIPWPEAEGTIRVTPFWPTAPASANQVPSGSLSTNLTESTPPDRLQRLLEEMDERSKQQGT
ncbi:MAG: type IV secretory system conjugative DNA transfer family protein [Planctomycetaceae bacterium]